MRPSTSDLAANNRELLPIFLALILVGVAGNVLHFQIFLNIDFLFGSIFSLLALQLFGLRRGVIAAALISAYTIILWNHPYACIILAAEVAVVGWLLPRSKIGLPLADTLYWLFIGMPLVFLFYYGVMGVPWEGTSIVMIKTAVNGIANALIARLLFAGYTRLSHRQLLPFREILSTLLGLFVLTPALLLLAIDSRNDFARIDQHIRATLLHDREVLSTTLNGWIETRRQSIVTLASLATTLAPAEMQSRLEQTRSSDPSFLRVALLDQGATTVAVTPLTDELGRVTIGRNFSDRPFIPLLKKNLQPLLSEVVMARIGPPQPVVHLLAPVVKDSEYAGYLLGALNLDRIGKILEMNATRDSQLFTLLDRHGKTIITNHREQTVMTPFHRGQGRLFPQEEGIAQWIPTLPAHTPIMERWKKSYYVTEASIGGGLSAWTLLLEQPVAPFQQQLYDTYSRKLSLLFAVLLCALLCGELLSRLMTRSSEELLAITSDLPTRLSGGYPIVWPQSTIFETKRLIENVRSMTDKLAEQFNAIRKLNLTLEERVEVRTRELTESRERYDLALLGSQDGIWDWNIQTGEIYFSGRWFEMLGYEANELPHTIDLFESLVHPEDLEPVRNEVRHHLQDRTPYSVEYRILQKGGGYSWIHARGQALWNEVGRAVRMAGSHTDITERKQIETQILASLREKEVLLKEIHHRVKNNLQIVHSLLTLQANGISDDQVRALFEESRDRIGSMALIHEKLYSSEDLSHINFSQYLLELAENIADTYQRQEIHVVVGVVPIFLDINSGIPCGLIVNELVSNSFKYAFPEGRAGEVTISLTYAEGSGYELTVADNGVGFPEEIDFRQTASLGMQLVSVLTEQLQGSITLKREPGTRFLIRFSGQRR